MLCGKSLYLSNTKKYHPDFDKRDIWELKIKGDPDLQGKVWKNKG